MKNDRRYLMAFESKDGSKILVDFESNEKMQKYKLEAEPNEISCKQIKIEEYNRIDFYGCRYFDLNNPHTRQNFELEDWLVFLRHWKNHESGDRHFYNY